MPITHLVWLLISVIRPSPRKCFTLDQTKEFFPLNDNMDTLKLRNRNKYRVTEGNTERIQEFYNIIHPENAELKYKVISVNGDS